MYIIGMFFGLLVDYALGTAWLAAQSHLSFTAAIAAGVLPFIPGDIIKVIAITAIAPPIRKRLLQAGVLQAVSD
jgi:biotin transport system substrate-specific component